MFTGIVEEIGILSNIEKSSSGMRLTINAHRILEDMKLGDSIAVSGVCQTVVKFSQTHFTVEVSNETLEVTTFRKIKSGDHVNLERALRLSDRLGGHIINGHVDGTGELIEIKKEGFSSIYQFKIPSSLARYTVYKGSVCIDGISLTISDINAEGTVFAVTIVPHTFENTTLINLKPGSVVNIETDILGKYIEKLILNNNLQIKPQSNVTMEYLIEHGFA